MKHKNILNITLLSILALLYSCDDSLNNLGFTIQPESDRITVGADTLFLSAKTVSVESMLPEGMFTKTKTPVLGEYRDSLFGTIKSDYICEFYYPEGKNFPDNAIIDSVRAAVLYSSWIGDSLAPIGLSAYEVNKNLPASSFFSNFNPTEYANMDAPLGQTVFSAANYNIPKEERESYGYYHHAFIDLPKSIGDSIFHWHETIDDLNTDSFKELFKGLYLTTDFGSGTVLTIDHTYLYVHFSYVDKKGSSTKKDTVLTGNMVLNTSPEVIQINQIQSKNDKLLEDNSDYTYIKSPAGVFTEVHFPFTDKEEILNNQELNLAKFRISALPYEDSKHKFRLPPSPFLLLVNKDNLKDFFEKRRVPDNVTSFYAQYNPATDAYNFGNLATMINYYKKKNSGKVKDLTYILVPVELEVSNISGQQQVTAVYNQMVPTATTLYKTPEKLKMELVFSKL